MNKFSLTAIFLTLTIIIGGVFLFSKNSRSNPAPWPPASYEYFWGDGCPHCAIIAKFMETWKAPDGIEIKKLEVWGNRTNADLMLERVKSCNITQSDMGVPFLVTPQGKCYTGDTQIIELFKSL